MTEVFALIFKPWFLAFTQVAKSSIEKLRQNSRTWVLSISRQTAFFVQFWTDGLALAFMWASFKHALKVILECLVTVLVTAAETFPSPPWQELNMGGGGGWQDVLKKLMRVVIFIFQSQIPESYLPHPPQSTRSKTASDHDLVARVCLFLKCFHFKMSQGLAMFFFVLIGHYYWR